MSRIIRKIQRNMIKNQIKKDGMKINQPLSKYRFKTKEELEKERAEMLTEKMLETAKNSGNLVNNE